MLANANVHDVQKYLETLQKQSTDFKDYIQRGFAGGKAIFHRCVVGAKVLALLGLWARPRACTYIHPIVSLSQFGAPLPLPPSSYITVTPYCGAVHAQEPLSP